MYKNLTALFLVFSFNSFALDCSSVGVSSCSTNEGNCFEYTDFNMMPEAQIKSICGAMGGVYSKNICDKKFDKGTCINEMNPIMPIIRFDESLDSESAKLFCETSGGTLCN